MKTLPFAILILTACTSELTKPGQEVKIVENVPPEQSASYKDIGDVVVEEPSQFKGDEEDARQQLRNYAARDGAELVLLQENSRVPCEIDHKQTCVQMKGRKLQRADVAEHPSEVL